MLKAIKNWDVAFSNTEHVTGAVELPAAWLVLAKSYRESGVRIEENIAYGSHPREVFDLVWPDTQPKGLVVFIHGGYWMRLDKSYWTHLAEGARANGWAVCIPSYTLAPEARITDITAQMANAVSTAAERVAGPIHVSGHSAGGHLAARMACDDSALPARVIKRIAHTLSISGLHDLRPIMQTKMNDLLHLDEEEARRESPALRRPASNTPLTCWVGGGELAELVRQSELMAKMWEGLDVPICCMVDGEHNHFTVIEGLHHPDSAITTCLLSSGRPGEPHLSS